MADPDTIKSVLRMFTYGLFVASSAGPQGPRAATVSWVTQASFEPKLVAVGLRKGTAIYEAVCDSKRFALHVVGAHQQEFARAFFKGSTTAEDALGGYRFGLNERGVPIFGSAIAWIECEVSEEANAAGDHAILIARVVDADITTPSADPLSLRDTIWHYGG
jgi:flavin reductase (DIM6/NTAB) family NADH-FMN oxidoreductase RutF